MTPFFVTGLPRSRTAWMSMWLTTDTTLCYHDELYRPELLNNGRRVGFSSSELIWQFGDIWRKHPRAPWLHIIRSPNDALDSWVKVAGRVVDTKSELFKEQWKRRLDAFLEINCDAVKHVQFEDLDDAGVAKQIWQHLIGTPFDSERWNILRDFNVQQKFDQVYKERTAQCAF